MNSETSIDQNIAFHLKEKVGSQFEYAWILNKKPVGLHLEGRIYWAGFPKGIWAPGSALIKLVQGLFDRYQDQSFFLLRQRIQTTAKIKEWEKGLIRLAAKRASGEIQSVQGEIDSSWTLEEIGNKEDLIFKSAIQQAPIETPSGPANVEKDLDFLRSQVDRGDVLHDFNRPVSVMLVSADGKTLACSVHGGKLNKTLHAETRLCQEFFGKHQTRFPDGSRLYVSLKPCQMCAGMIVRMSEGLADFSVHYLEEDLGPMAQNTLLEKQGKLKQGL